MGCEIMFLHAGLESHTKPWKLAIEDGGAWAAVVETIELLRKT
jgi:hypothetical protein